MGLLRDEGLIRFVVDGETRAAKNRHRQQKSISRFSLMFHVSIFIQLYCLGLLWFGVGGLGI